MPTLLQLNVTSNWGSTGKIAEAIGQTAQKHGWQSYVAFGRMSNHSNNDCIKVGNKFDVYEHYAEYRILDNQGLASRHATKLLIKEIEQISPDVVQLHNIHDHWLNYELLFNYLNSTDIKVVWTFHDCWAFTGHCYHFVESNCFKWKNGCFACPQKGKFLDRSKRNWLLKKDLFTSNRNLTLVPVSEWMGDFVKQSFLKDKRIRVIHNGIDINTFKVIHGTSKCDDKFHIIAVSNVWLPYKGIFDIFKLRELLSDEYEITMVGLSSDQIKTLPNGIHGITRTQNVQQLVELYNEADVLINPTYADTFPTVNLEALACGTPVITYKTGGSPEAIDEKTGVVVEQGNVTALANAIMQMKDKPLSAEACRKRAVEYFDKDKCFEKYVELYEELLNGK